MSLITKRKCEECGRWVDKSTPHTHVGFDEPQDPWELKGWLSALDGVTCNPYAAEPQRGRWIAGYDRAAEAGLAKLPRFGKLRSRADA